MPFEDFSGFQKTSTVSYEFQKILKEFSEDSRVLLIIKEVQMISKEPSQRICEAIKKIELSLRKFASIVPRL